MAAMSHRGFDAGASSTGGKRWIINADQHKGSRYDFHHIGETRLGLKFNQDSFSSDLAQRIAPFSHVQSIAVSPHAGIVRRMLLLARIKLFELILRSQVKSEVRLQPNNSHRLKTLETCQTTTQQPRLWYITQYQQVNGTYQLH